MALLGGSCVIGRSNTDRQKKEQENDHAEVRGGGTIVVYDRNTPIAQLVPFQEDEDDLVIVEPSLPITALKKLKGVRPRKPVDTDKLLSELRADR